MESAERAGIAGELAAGGEGLGHVFKQVAMVGQDRQRLRLGRLDAGEFLDVFTATPQQLAIWCREGVVTDAKTVAGLLWVQQVLSGAWTLDWHAPDAAATP